MDSKKEETIAKFLQTIEKLYYLEELSADEIAHKLGYVFLNGFLF